MADDWTLNEPLPVRSAPPQPPQADFVTIAETPPDFRELLDDALAHKKRIDDAREGRSNG